MYSLCGGAFVWLHFSEYIHSDEPVSHDRFSGIRGVHTDAERAGYQRLFFLRVSDPVPAASAVFYLSVSFFSLCGLLCAGFSCLFTHGIFYFHAGKLLWMGGNDQRHWISDPPLFFLRNCAMCDIYLSVSKDTFVQNVHVFGWKKIFFYKK